jgi:hypothetical protein
MSTPEENDPLNALLREQHVYVDDAGFTARVLKALPPRRRAWVRPLILMTAIVISSVLAVLWLPWQDLTPLNVSDLTAPNSAMLLPWILIISVVGSLVWSLFALIPRED